MVGYCQKRGKIGGNALTTHASNLVNKKFFFYIKSTILHFIQLWQCCLVCYLLHARYRNIFISDVLSRSAMTGNLYAGGTKCDHQQAMQQIRDNLHQFAAGHIHPQHVQNLMAEMNVDQVYTFCFI